MPIPLSPANELASAVIEIMRIEGIGAYSSKQITWWEQIIQDQTGLVDAYWNLDIDEVCYQTDQKLNLTAGATKAQWSESVVAPGVLLVAKILAKVTSTIEHAPTVRQHLAAAGLSPEQAASRLTTSLPAINRIVSDRTSRLPIKTICAPVWESGQYSWLQSGNEYKDVSQILRAANQLFAGAASLHPISTGTWRIMIRAVNVVLNAPIRCRRIEIDVMNRFWPEASVKIMATMLTHPTAEAIDRLVLKTIIHNSQGADAGILATQKYLEEQSFEGIAAPLFIVDVLEKTPYMDKTELANAFVAGLGGTYSVCNIDRKKLGTLVWNTVPAPWVKAAKPTTLPAQIMDRYNQAKHKIDRSVAAIANTVREAECNPSMASINLTWERAC